MELRVFYVDLANREVGLLVDGVRYLYELPEAYFYRTTSIKKHIELIAVKSPKKALNWVKRMALRPGKKLT